MITLQITLKGHKDFAYPKCDRYEVKDETTDDFVEKWLVLYRGDKESGRYKLDEVLGYHEYE